MEWARGAVTHVRQLNAGAEDDQVVQPTPVEIPQVELDPDGSGHVATYQPGGKTITANNAFFKTIGTNGRTCLTCHQPQTGWTVSAADVAGRFDATNGADPLFRMVDGATCPTVQADTPPAKRQAFALLLDKGLIRIGLPLPAASEFEVSTVSDPYHCSTDPAIGLTSPAAGILSVYRRPLPATNLGFQTTIMWDGREPDLAHQAATATLIHAQAAQPPSAEEQQQIVDFERGLFTAQFFDSGAGHLNARDASGGPFALWQQLPDFFPGVNNPAGQNSNGRPFSPQVFTLFQVWEDLTPPPAISAASAGALAVEPIAATAPPPPPFKDDQRQAIARGERIFNTKPLHITNVAGLNDVAAKDDIAGTCSTCHNTPNVGSNSLQALLNIGTTNAGVDTPPVLDISDLPVIILTCKSGPLTDKVFTVTDPGRALITGKCSDIGKVKIPALRGLAARPPYFHNGSARSLEDLVTFYDLRFAIGLSEQEKKDLVVFLGAL